jgi:hypothetical protein
VPAGLGKEVDVDKSKNRHSFRRLMFPFSPPSEVLPVALPPAPQAPARSAHDSHVRLRVPPLALPRAADIDFLDAEEVLDELGEDQLTMSMNLTCLEEQLAQAPRDPSARAALRTLSARLEDLGSVRDALAQVQAAAVDPRLQRLLVPDAPLADYLRGVYAWAHAVLRALDDLSKSMRALQPDWALLRWRLEEAKNFHFDELSEPIRADLLSLSIMAAGGAFGADPPQVLELESAVARLFAAAGALEGHLDERFG